MKTIFKRHAGLLAGAAFCAAAGVAAPHLARAGDTPHPRPAAGAQDAGQASAFSQAIRAVTLPKTDPQAVIEAARALSDMYDADHARATVIFMRLMMRLNLGQDEGIRFAACRTLAHIAYREPRLADLILDKLRGVHLKDAEKNRLAAQWVKGLEQNMRSGLQAPAPQEP
jgi:hypothetical protein